jgi:riboflavin biosynthesis pyrimidine reductase
VLSTLDSGPVIIVYSDRALGAADRVTALSAAGAHLVVPVDDDLPSAFRAMYDMGVTSLLLEGGPTLFRAALNSDMVDAVQLYITPRRLGPDGVRWLDAGQLAWETFSERHATWVGKDLLVEAQLRDPAHHVHGHR